MAEDAAELVAAHEPDVVIVWGGYNDVVRGATPTEAADRMDALVDVVRAAGAPRIVLVSTFRPHTALGDTVDAFTDLARERAAARDVELADVRAETDDSATWIECTDNVHPTHRGYEKAGEVIGAALRRGRR